MSKKKVSLVSFTEKEKAALQELLKSVGEDPKLIYKIREDLWSYDYYEKPVTFQEFCTNPRYLGHVSLYDKWKIELTKFFDQGNYTELILTGAIGTGKTTAGCVALLYKIYQLLCMKNPWDYFGLLKGSPIVLGLYNVFKWKAGGVVLDTFKSILRNIEWFKDKVKEDDIRSNWILFPNNIKIIIGATELDALGENLYGCLIDEVNFMRVTREERKQAESLYYAIKFRLKSRFERYGRVPGLIILVSSKRTEADFLNVHLRKNKDLTHSYVCDFALWEVKPQYFSLDKIFKVQVGDRYRRTRILENGEKPEPGAKVIDVPIECLNEFKLDPDKALRDLAGVATYTYRPLITDPDRLLNCIDLNRERPTIEEYVLCSLDDKVELADSIYVDKLARKSGTMYVPLVNPQMPRFIHLDLSQRGDYTGIAMVHHAGYIEEEKLDLSGTRYKVYVPKFYVDLVWQLRYGNSRIDFSKIRSFIFYLKYLGFKIGKITADSYQSADFLQIMSKAGYATDTISVDKKSEPYMYLKEIIYGGRLNLYRHELLQQEILQLEYDASNDKVDHQTGGSKDIADALTGAIWTCYQVVGGRFRHYGVEQKQVQKVELEYTGDVREGIHSLVGGTKELVIDKDTQFSDLGGIIYG